VGVRNFVRDKREPLGIRLRVDSNEASAMNSSSKPNRSFMCSSIFKCSIRVLGIDGGDPLYVLARVRPQPMVPSTGDDCDNLLQWIGQDARS
jgi:hypothetical protein